MVAAVTASRSCSAARCPVAASAWSRSPCRSPSWPPPAAASAWTWRRSARSRSASGRRHQRPTCAAWSTAASASPSLISVLVAVAHRRRLAAARRQHATAIALGRRLDPARRGGQHLPGRDPRPEVGWRPTLWVFWIGQPVAWIAVAGAAIALGGSTWAAVIGRTTSPGSSPRLLARGAVAAPQRRDGRRAGQPRASCVHGAAVRRAPRPVRPARPGAVLGRPVGARRTSRRGNTLDTYAAVGPHLAGDPAVPDLAQPAVLALRGRPPRPRPPRPSWTRCSRAPRAGR